MMCGAQEGEAPQTLAQQGEAPQALAQHPAADGGQALQVSTKHSVHFSDFIKIFSIVRKRLRTAISPATQAQCVVLLFQNYMYSTFTSIVNVIIFAIDSSRCAVYFEKCGQC